MAENPKANIFFQIAGFFVFFLGMISIKVIPAILCIVILFSLNIEFESNWYWAILFFVGWGTLLLVGFPVGWFIAGLGSRLVGHSENFAKSYIADYGEYFAKPTFEEFDLKAEDYYSYNRRFKLSDWGVIVIAPCAVGAAFLYKSIFGVESSANKFLMFVCALGFAIVGGLLVRLIDRRLSSRYPQDSAVREYQTAMDIYNGVQEEIRLQKIRQRFG